MSRKEDDDRYWGTAALRRFGLFGPPLRPVAEDMDLLAGAVARRMGRNGTLRLLLLGSTPEVWALAREHGWAVMAVDRARAMLSDVWPGPRASTCCADWTHLPLAAGGQDVVFLDGGLQMLAYPDGHAALAAQVRRVLRPGGCLVLRAFVLPRQRETVADVIAALRTGAVRTPDELRMRLWMAVQASPEQGVALRRVWEVLAAAEPDLDALAERCAWDAERVRVVEGYAHASERDHLTDVPTIAQVFRSYGFTLTETAVPGYPLGACCPTLVLERDGDIN